MDQLAYLGRTLNTRAADTALEIGQIVRGVVNSLASRGQTGASVKNIDTEAMRLLTNKINDACQFAFNVTGGNGPEVKEAITYFAERVEKIIADEVRPVAGRLGIRQDQAARIFAIFFDQLRSRKEQLLDDFSHGMLGSERLKKDPVLSVVTNQTNSPGGVQLVGIGDKFSQAAFSQNHQALVAAIDRTLSSPEFAQLAVEQKEGFSDLAKVVKDEASKNPVDPGSLKRWSGRLVSLAKDLGMNVAAAEIVDLVGKMFGS